MGKFSARHGRMVQMYLGIEVGAESGRVMAGHWDGARLRLEEVHLFRNGAWFTELLEKFGILLLNQLTADAWQRWWQAMAPLRPSQADHGPVATDLTEIFHLSAP